MNPLHRTYELLIILAAIAGLALPALHAIQGRKATTSLDYFLAKRGVSWVSLGLSLFATSMWGLWSTGLVRPVDENLAGWLFPGAVMVVSLAVLGIGFALPYRASGAVTMPSFLGERFGRHVSLPVAVASIVLTVFVQIPFTILVATQLVNTLMGWDPTSTGLLMVIIPGLFAVAGGYSSAMALQSAGGIVAGIGLLVMAVIRFPAGGVLQHALGGAEPSWPSLAAGIALMGFWSSCVEQQVVQRVLAARSEMQARTGSFLAAGLAILGVVAVVAGSAGVGSPIVRTTSSGVAVGFVVATVMVLAMSSLSVHFMSVSTLVTMDIVRAARKASGEAALVLAGRLTATVVVILAILSASSATLIGPLVLEWIMPFTVVVAPPVTAIMILGVALPRMHGRGAFSALVAGWTAGIVQVEMNPQSPIPVVESSVVTFAVAAIVFISVSLTVAPLGSLRKVPKTIVQVRKP